MGVSFLEVKTLNLKNSREVERYRRQLVIIKRQLELQVQRKFRRYFIVQGKKLVKELRKPENRDYMKQAAIGFLDGSEQQRNGKVILDKHYEKSFKVADKFIKKGAKAHFPQLLHRKDVLDFEQAILEFIRKFSAQHIVGITEETKRKVSRVIEAGVANGDTTIDIEKNILKVYSGFSLRRAGVIARTETTQAVGTGARTSFRSFGFQNPKKTWLHTDQDDPRPEHVDMDNVTIDMDAKYKVDNPNGGYDLMDGPGDNSAPPEQTINCSCVEGFDATDEL